MEHKYKTFINHEVNEFVDHNVYKLNTRQQFRNVLSVKYYGPDEKYKTRNRDNAGYILNDLKPETQIVTPDGYERLSFVITVRRSTNISCDGSQTSFRTSR